MIILVRDFFLIILGRDTDSSSTRIRNWSTYLNSEITSLHFISSLHALFHRRALKKSQSDTLYCCLVELIFFLFVFLFASDNR